MTSNQLARRTVRLSQVKEEAGLQDSNAITKEKKRALADAGTPFLITDLKQEEGDNGPFWVITIELEDVECVFFMGENEGNQALFNAMHRTVVGEGAGVGPMRLRYIPERVNRRGEKKHGFYKLEEADESYIEAPAQQSSFYDARRSEITAAIEGTAHLLSDGMPKASPRKPANANQLATIAKLSRLLGQPEEIGETMTSADASERIRDLSREYNARQNLAGTRRSAPSPDPDGPATPNQIEALAKLRRILGQPEELDEDITFAEAVDATRSLSAEVEERTQTAAPAAAIPDDDALAI